MGMKDTVSRQLAPHVPRLAPELTTTFVREALVRAINGIGPFPPAAKAAEKQLAEQRGDVERGIHEVIENHVRYAGAQGFVTNLGGLVTAAVAIPTNVSGLALVECRMVAGIAHLRGYDLDHPNVRDAILLCMLGEDTVSDLVKKRKIPGTPHVVATLPQHDPDLDRLISGEVASNLLAKVAGKRVAVAVARRTPVVGGLVGAGADGFTTWRVGRYADRELLPRTQR
jgi:EcsC protein family